MWKLSDGKGEREVGLERKSGKKEKVARKDEGVSRSGSTVRRNGILPCEPGIDRKELVNVDEWRWA